MNSSLLARLKRWVKGLMLKHMHQMITCEEFEAFVASYIDDTLPAAQRQIFELHLRICRECREYLAAYQRAIELGQSVFSDAQAPTPEDVPEDLIRAILAARSDQQ